MVRKYTLKMVDFDTIDLLTKRFNSKKKLPREGSSMTSTLSAKYQSTRWSKKYSKIGSGVIYFNNKKDLFNGLQLLGGSIKAGNDSAKNEFSEISNVLRRSGIIERAIHISSSDRFKFIT